MLKKLRSKPLTKRTKDEDALLQRAANMFDANEIMQAYLNNYSWYADCCEIFTSQWYKCSACNSSRKVTGSLPNLTEIKIYYKTDDFTLEELIYKVSEEFHAREFEMCRYN